MRFNGGSRPTGSARRQASSRLFHHVGEGVEIPRRDNSSLQRYIAHPNEVKRLPDAVAVVKLDHVAGRGRTVTAVPFWPPEADWPVPAARWSAAPAAIAAPAVEEVPYDDLPRLPDPQGLNPI